jgi:hypothetical protein
MLNLIMRLELVPIPTLPELSIRIRSALLVEKVKGILVILDNLVSATKANHVPVLVPFTPEIKYSTTVFH